MCRTFSLQIFVVSVFLYGSCFATAGVETSGDPGTPSGVLMLLNGSDHAIVSGVLAASHGLSTDRRHLELQSELLQGDGDGILSDWWDSSAEIRLVSFLRYQPLALLDLHQRFAEVVADSIGRIDNAFLHDLLLAELEVFKLNTDKTREWLEANSYQYFHSGMGLSDEYGSMTNYNHRVGDKVTVLYEFSDSVSRFRSRIEALLNEPDSPRAISSAHSDVFLDPVFAMLEHNTKYGSKTYSDPLPLGRPGGSAFDLLTIFKKHNIDKLLDELTKTRYADRGLAEVVELIRQRFEPNTSVPTLHGAFGNFYSLDLSAYQAQQGAQVYQTDLEAAQGYLRAIKEVIAAMGSTGMSCGSALTRTRRGSHMQMELPFPAPPPNR